MMSKQRAWELGVGCFVIMVAAALSFLVIRASHTHSDLGATPILVTADFDDISGLHVRAPVSIAGVTIGQVRRITLDPQTYKAHVELAINRAQAPIPVDSAVSIMTEGLLGSKYITIAPGFSTTYLSGGEHLNKTTSAFVLERVLGQFLFSGNRKS